MGFGTPSLRTAFFEKSPLSLQAEQDILRRKKPKEYLTGYVAFVFGIHLLKEPFYLLLFAIALLLVKDLFNVCLHKKK